MWQYNFSDNLYHYGVKGMKWDVRLRRVTSSTASSSLPSSNDIILRRYVGKTNNAEQSSSDIILRRVETRKSAATKIKKNKTKLLSIKAKSGEPLFAESDINRLIDDLENV